MQSLIAPFKGSPNPNLLFTTPGILGSLEKIRFMVAERQGLALILGDNGMGKSSVLRYLLAEYSAEGYTTALLNQTEFPSPYGFLKAISAQFGIENKRSQALQHAALEEWLVGQYQDGKTVLLFVDEGQRLTAELLEVVRALLNCETYDDKLLQIVMAGTLELRDRIIAKRNKALRSRIFAPCMLNALTAEETAGMIAFRCHRAGLKNPFTDDAIRRVYELSEGIPRQSLILCAHAYNLARRLKIHPVPPDLIDAASNEVTFAAAAAV